MRPSCTRVHDVSLGHAAREEKTTIVTTPPCSRIPFSAERADPDPRRDMAPHSGLDPRATVTGVPRGWRQDHLRRRDFLVVASCALAGLTVGAASSPNGDPALVNEAGARIDHLTTTHFREEFRQLVRCGARTIHVSSTGSDENRGTIDEPFREISRAIQDARPGDLILVAGGEYGHIDIRNFRGQPDAWLGIMATGEEHSARITVPPPTDNFLNIVDSTYVGLYGFEIAGQQDNPNTNGSGISVHANSHHVAIWRNYVHDFPGGGINCFDVDGSHDLVDISYNRICRTSRYSPNNTSGISIFAPRDLTGGEVFPDGYGFRVIGNYIFDVLCTVPFAPGGFPYVTDGNGVSLDRALTEHDYRKAMLVRDNVITGCGGRAVHAYQTVNVDIINNTAIGNLRTDSPSISGGVELDGTVGSSVAVLSNIICPLNTPNSTDRVSRYAENAILGGTQSVLPGDFDLRNVGLSYFRGPLAAESLITGNENLSVFASSTSY